MPFLVIFISSCLFNYYLLSIPHSKTLSSHPLSLSCYFQIYYISIHYGMNNTTIYILFMQLLFKPVKGGRDHYIPSFTGLYWFLCLFVWILIWIWDQLHSVWRTSFGISLSTDPWAVNSLMFFPPRNVFISFSLFKIGFTRYRIPDWQLLSFSTLTEPSYLYSPR